MVHWSPTKIPGLRPVATGPEWIQYDLPFGFKSKSGALKPWTGTYSFEEIVPFPIEEKTNQEGEVLMPNFFKSFASGF